LADGSVTGRDSCGPMSGSYEVDGDRISFDVTVDPGTVCDERFAEQSAHIESVLASGAIFEIDGPRLTLTAVDGRDAGLMTTPRTG
jgi:heat shock protein HslJ